MPEDQQHRQIGTATVGLQLHAPVALSRDDLRRHLYIIGKTGTGKSTLLYNLMLADLVSGHGFALLDPHGDLATAIADATPEWRIERGVIYLDPADLAHPVGFNPLNNVAIDQRPLVAAHMVFAPAPNRFATPVPCKGMMTAPGLGRVRTPWCWRRPLRALPI